MSRFGDTVLRYLKKFGPVDKWFLLQLSPALGVTSHAQLWRNFKELTIFLS
jgi:hypothetical protein